MESGLRRLKEFGRRQTGRKPTGDLPTPPEREICELCASPIGAEHEHLVEPATGNIMCSCRACSLLFPSRPGMRYLVVPREVTVLRDFPMSEAEWEALKLPVELAFFYHRSRAGRVVAVYPSPAGPMESTLELEHWQASSRGSPALSALRPDVEAWLVNRAQGAKESFVAPIDECYKLIGLIRTKWKGMSGGDEVREAIERFFVELREKGQAT